MDANEVYQVMLYVTAKNRQNGYLSPDDFHVAINTAQRSYLDLLLGEYQKYQVQRPIAVVEFGQNERVRQSIAPLIYGAILHPFTYNGIAPFPNDFEYIDAMWSLYGSYNIRFAQQDRQDSFLHSEIDPIADNPVYLIQHEGFHFFPENIGSAKMSYVRKPPSIVWAYVNDSNGRPVYDPFNSQQPVWGDSDMLNIIVRALQLVGVNLQLGAVIQYSQEIKNSGQ
jgi:hypothetical protein